VIAVDAVPALLQRLEAHATALGLDNIETRRGGFLRLPLEDASVDLAVACSALTSHAPWGGEEALREATRIVRSGGQVVVIWPDDPAWFTARGFAYLSLPGNDELRFADVATAERICRDFYSDEAAEWVRSHGSATIPFAVLGIPPPSDACFLRVGEAPPPRPYGEGHPRPGVEVH
jgi:ubiquinone/menaquinone biosynthesis C-methylase UbiE